MEELNSKTISAFPKKFTDVIQKEFWSHLSCEDLFPLLSLDEKNFAVISNLILNKRDKKAYPYQVRLLKKLSQMEAVSRDTLLEISVGSTPLIEKIKVFTDEVEGEATLYGWILCAQYSGFKPTLDEELIDLLAKTNVLHLFSNFLTADQCKDSLPVFLNKFRSSGNRSIAKEAVTIFIERLVVSHRSNEIFNLIEENLESDPDIAEMSLIALIKAPVMLNEIDEILNFIKKYLYGKSKLAQPFLLNALTLFITTFGTSRRTDEIFNLIIKSFGGNRLFVWEAALKVLIAFVATPAGSNKADEVFDFITKSLDDNELRVRQATLKVLIAFIATSAASDKVFDLITKSLDHNKPRVWQATLNVLTVFVATPAASDKADKVFDLITKSLGNNKDWVRKDTLNVLTAFIATPAASDKADKADKVFDLITKSLGDGESLVRKAAVNALIAFIATPAASDKADKVFDLITKSLGNNKDWVRKDTLNVLTAFIATPAASDKADKIFDLITKSLGDKDWVREAAVNALTAFIARLDVSDKVFDFITKSLDDNEPQVRKATLKTLAIFIATPAVSQKADEILKLIKKRLDGNKPWMWKTALKIFSACIKNKIPVTQDVCEKAFKNVLQSMSDDKSASFYTLRKNSLHTLTVLIKHFSSEGIGYTASAIETEKVSRFMCSLASSKPIKDQSLKNKLEALIENHRGKQKTELLKDVTALISKAQNVTEIKNLFNLCDSNLNILNSHKNPNLDKILGIKNTKRWSVTVKEIREMGLVTLFKEVKTKSNVHKKKWLLEWAKKQSLFSQHRSNFIFTGAFWKTAAASKIDEEINKLSALNQLKLI